MGELYLYMFRAVNWFTTPVPLLTTVLEMATVTVTRIYKAQCSFCCVVLETHTADCTAVFYYFISDGVLLLCCK